jgi:acetyl esterase/lipase
MPAHLRRAAFVPPLLLLALLAGCAQGASGAHRGAPQPRATADKPILPPVAYTANLRSDIAYGPLPGESLDLCAPQGATTRRPGVLMIHGGAWSGGDKGMYDDLCRLLAQHGFLAATMNYRLAPTSVWPAQLVDAQLAVRWLRASARRINLDPSRLCAYGDSAGAHLAVFLGVAAAIHPGDEAALYTNESPQATCIVDAFGPVDLTLRGATPLQQSILQLLFGGASLADDPAGYRDASPLFLISPKSAPTLIIQGSSDTLVPPSQSQALRAALRAKGVPVQYLSYDGGHEFSGLSQQQFEAVILQIGFFLTAQEHP